MYSFRNEDLPLNREIRNSLKVIWGVGWWKSIFISSKLVWLILFLWRI